MLQLKLGKVSFSEDGTQLVVQDTTGAYNSVTNPGGYGAPNWAISTNLILRYKLFNSPDWTVLPGLTQSLLTNGYTIDTVALGLSTIPQLLPDGVELIQYLGLYSKGNTVGVISGSNRINISNFSLSDFTSIDYIALGSNLNMIYKILSRGSNYLIVDSCYSGSLTTETIYDAQNGDLLNLVQTYTKSELDNQVAACSEEQLYGEKLNSIFYRMMRLFTAQSRFDKMDYYGSDLIMQNLFRTCFARRHNI